PSATRRAHHYGEMQIKNVWQVARHDDEGKLPAAQEEVLKEKPKIKERPLFQPKERMDVAPEEVKRYEATNTALLFHGTRSVNVSGILRQAPTATRRLRRSTTASTARAAAPACSTTSSSSSTRIKIGCAT